MVVAGEPDVDRMTPATTATNDQWVFYQRSLVNVVPSYHASNDHSGLKGPSLWVTLGTL